MLEFCCIWCFVVLLLFNGFQLSQGCVTPVFSNQNTVLQLRCLLSPFGGTASWFIDNIGPKTSCAANGFCNTRTDGNYTYSSDLKGIYATIDPFLFHEKGKVWKCDHSSLTNCTITVSDPIDSGEDDGEGLSDADKGGIGTAVAAAVGGGVGVVGLVIYKKRKGKRKIEDDEEETELIPLNKNIEIGKLIQNATNVKWQKDGIEVENNHSHETMYKITNASLRDEGVYTCTYGSDNMQLKYRLIVVGRKEPVYVQKGHKVEFGKTIHDTKVSAKIKWMLDGKEVETTKIHGTMIRINNASAKDKGTYVCTFGSNNMQLTYNLIPVGTEETVFGNKDHTVVLGMTIGDLETIKDASWTKDGKIVQKSEFQHTVVTITHASSTDEGTYVCTFGSNKMKLTYHLILVGTKETVRVKKGHKVKFGKTIRDMDTTKSAKWSKNGSYLQSNCFKRTNITIDNASTDDEGTYVCTFGTPSMQLTYDLVLEGSTNTATNGNETTTHQHGMTGQHEDQCDYINETEKSKHIGSAQASEKAPRKSSPSLTNLSEAAK